MHFLFSSVCASPLRSDNVDEAEEEKIGKYLTRCRYLIAHFSLLEYGASRAPEVFFRISILGAMMRQFYCVWGESLADRR